MLATALLSVALAAVSALAIPTTKERFAARHARRSRSGQLAQNAFHNSSIVAASNAVVESSNWAGGVYESYPAVSRVVTPNIVLLTPFYAEHVEVDHGHVQRSAPGPGRRRHAELLRCDSMGWDRWRIRMPVADLANWRRLLLLQRRFD
jgi:hypothetical protein